MRSTLTSLAIAGLSCISAASVTGDKYAHAQQQLLSTLFKDDQTSGPKLIPDVPGYELNLQQQELDYNRICGAQTNITLSTSRGNITFRDGYILESDTQVPTVWTLSKESSGDKYTITAIDPIGRSLSWSGGYDRVQISTSSPTKFDINTQALQDRGQLVVSHETRCLSFTNERWAVMNANTACEPLIFTKALPPPWTNPTQRSAFCSEAIYDEFASDLQNKIKAFMAAGAADDVHAEDFWDSVKNGAKKLGNAVSALNHNFQEAVNRIDPNWPRNEYRSVF